MGMKPNKFAELWKSRDVGNSVVLPNKDADSLSSVVYTNGGNVVTRRVNVGDILIWKKLECVTTIWLNPNNQ